MHHRSCPFLAIRLVSFFPFSLLAPISSDHLPLQHVQSSSSFCPISFLLSFSFRSWSSFRSFVVLSIQLTFPILLHTHISKAFKRFMSSFLMVHVSHPYRTTGHTSVLTNLFLRSTLILLVSSSFVLLNASFAFPILVLTSSKHLPSSEINEPRYLDLLTCSTL